MARTLVEAAGGIVLRRDDPARIAVVRLRKRNEWVLPKGKLARGEKLVRTLPADIASVAVTPASQWKIAGTTVPKVDGRDEAVAIAEEARRRGLTPAGVLDSSRYPSLRPGYWMAYQGSFGSEAEANGALRKARPVSRVARVERVSG